MITAKPPGPTDSPFLHAAGKARLGIGVYDAFTARLATQAEIDFLWLSSYCSSLSSGRPDCGLLDLSELAALTGMISAASTLPVLIDGGSSRGEVEYTRRLTEVCHEAGALGVCIEDYAGQKYSSLYRGLKREQVPRRAQQLCIAAAVQEAGNTGFLVVARCESLIAGKGADDLYDRCCDAAEVGASAIFIQSTLSTVDDLFAFLKRWQRQLPVIVAPTLYPEVPHEVLLSLGVTHVIYANQLMRAAHASMLRVLDLIRQDAGRGTVEAAISSVQTLSAIFPPMEPVRTSPKLR